MIFLLNNFIWLKISCNRVVKGWENMEDELEFPSVVFLYLVSRCLVETRRPYSLSMSAAFFCTSLYSCYCRLTLFELKSSQ